LVLLSDGRANVGMSDGESSEGSNNATPAEEARAIASLIQEKRIPSVVIDTELGFIQLGLAQSIAEAMGARYIKLDNLGANKLAEAVRFELSASEQPGLTAEEVRGLVRRLDLT
jgi:magnesium chelatase subunit D